MSNEGGTSRQGRVWDTAVENVIALASQADVQLETTPEGDVEVTNPVFESRPNIARRITRSQVEVWIERVASQTTVTLHRMTRLTEERRIVFAPAFANAVELGAAAYLVDAAYPQRAGVNDQASYGEVLWTRHRQAVADLAEALESHLAQPGDEDAAPRYHAGAGGFPTAAFTDRWVREQHPEIMLDPYHVPGTELPAAYRW